MEQVKMRQTEERGNGKEKIENSEGTVGEGQGGTIMNGPTSPTPGHVFKGEFRRG
jgi:hypothetical protein